MASLISKIIRRNNLKDSHRDCRVLTQEEINNAEYILHTVRVCSLAHISHKKRKRVKAEDIAKRICNEGVLMVNVCENLYMDIETGKYYELGVVFGEELKYPNNDLYVASVSPLYYMCYETIKQRKLDPNVKVSVKELRDIYNENFNQLSK